MRVAKTDHGPGVPIIKNDHVLGSTAKFLVEGRKALQALQACVISRECTQIKQNCCYELVSYAVRIVFISFLQGFSEELHVKRILVGSRKVPRIQLTLTPFMA